jgi:anti-sigma factor RsiW
MMMSTYEEIDCQELVEIVSDYLERALSQDEARRLEAHLVECEGCEAYVAQMQQTVTALRAVHGEAVEVDTEILLAAFRARAPEA